MKREGCRPERQGRRGLEHSQGSASAGIFSIKERRANAETKDNSKWQEGKGRLWLKVELAGLSKPTTLRQR